MQKSFRTYQQVVVIIGAVIGFACIRFYENILFYDPLLVFFKGENTALPLPEMELMRLLWGYFCRFWLNTFLSFGVIFVLFRDLHLLRFAALIYGVFFVLLLLLFLILYWNNNPESNLFLFYVRRFLIQPVLLLLFVPAFFYQKKIMGSRQ